MAANLHELPPIPMRKESYTTWLYLGFAIIAATATVFGFWYAGTGF